MSGHVDASLWSHPRTCPRPTRAIVTGTSDRRIHRARPASEDYVQPLGNRGAWRIHPSATDSNIARPEPSSGGGYSCTYRHSSKAQSTYGWWSRPSHSSACLSCPGAKETPLQRPASGRPRRSSMGKEVVPAVSRLPVLGTGDGAPMATSNTRRRYRVPRRRRGQERSVTKSPASRLARPTATSCAARVTPKVRSSAPGLAMG